jgi:aryl-alcohol dehydrogenase-like predicted oxidoreductase
MKYRQLGRSGLTVSALGMGAMNLSFGTGSAVDERTGISVLHAALDRGINFLTPLRHMVHIRMKNWLVMHYPLAVKRLLLQRNSALNWKMALGVDSRPVNIRAVAEASLKSLKTDYIDLFYQHRVDPNVPIEDVAGTVFNASSISSPLSERWDFFSVGFLRLREGPSPAGSA